MQGKSEGRGSLNRQSQDALALLQPLTQGALTSTPWEPFPPGRPRACAFSFQIPRLGGNQEEHRFGTRRSYNRSFICSFFYQILSSCP